jgi:hypothetical protein
MSQTPPPLAGITVRDERARTTLQLLAQSGLMAVGWVVLWKWVAPLLGVRVLDLGEFMQALTLYAYAIAPVGGGAPSQSLIEIMAGFLFWTFPVFVGLCGIATLSAALWYVVGRLIEPSTTADAGGDA